jgi:YD repeat-containing protein
MRNYIRRILAGVLLTVVLSALYGAVCVSTVYADGPSTTYTYDARGRLTRVEYSDGAIIEYTYDAAGNMQTHNLVPVGAVMNMTAVRQGGAVSLSWQHLGGGVLRYEVYRGTTPYFTPDSPGSKKLPDVPPPTLGSHVECSDLEAFNLPLTNYFYFIRAVGISGQPLAGSKRTGTFHFALTPGG